MIVIQFKELLLISILICFWCTFLVGDAVFIPHSSRSGRNPPDLPENIQNKPLNFRNIWKSIRLSRFRFPAFKDVNQPLNGPSRKHADFLQKHFTRNRDSFDYNPKFITANDYGVEIDKQGQLQKSHREFSIPHLEQMLNSLPDVDKIVYHDVDDLLDHYIDLDLIGVGSFGRVYRATTVQQRILPDGTVLNPGDPLAVKIQPVIQEETWRELEAMSRLLWLSKNRKTDHYAKPIGIYFASCGVFPIHADRCKGLKTYLPPFHFPNDLLCLCIEMEWLMKTFRAMNYHRYNQLTPIEMVDNEYHRPMPDEVAFEVIWGEMASAKYSHILVEDGHQNNYAVQYVDYWRVYRFVKKDEKGRVVPISQFAIPPDSPLPKRLDFNIWHPTQLNNMQMDRSLVGYLALKPAVHNLKDMFVSRFGMSPNARHVILELDFNARNLQQLLDDFFQHLKQPLDWSLPDNVRIYDSEL